MLNTVIVIACAMFVLSMFVFYVDRKLNEFISNTTRDIADLDDRARCARNKIETLENRHMMLSESVYPIKESIEYLKDIIAKERKRLAKEELKNTIRKLNKTLKEMDNV